MKKRSRSPIPRRGQPIRALHAWSYEPATQAAISHKVWEELDQDGQVTDRLDRGPIRLHVVFRFEMEHLLTRAGMDCTEKPVIGSKASVVE